MAFTRVWPAEPAATPSDAQAANLLGQDIRRLQDDVLERMNAALVADWTADPLVLRNKSRALFTSAAAQTNSGTAETDLIVFNMQAGSMSVDYTSSIEIDAWGIYAANGHLKTIKYYFGSTVLLNIGINSALIIAWELNIKIIRKTHNTQEALVSMRNTGDPNAYFATAQPSEELNGDLTLKATGTSDTASSDVFEVATTIMLKES